MALTTIPQKPIYTGEAPNRLTQQQSEFSANADNMMGYLADEAVNQNTVTNATNTLAGEIEAIGAAALANKNQTAADVIATANSAAAALASQQLAAVNANSVNGNPLGDYANGITFNTHNDYVSESGLFRLKASINPPYTTNTTTYPLAKDDPNLAPWSDVSEIQAIARSLNVLDSQVIYATNTTTQLGPILYIHDAATQKTWAKPADVGATEVIVSVSAGGVLTTDVSNYVMRSTIYDNQKIWSVSSGVSRALIDRFSDYVNVKDFGATGDGVADDYPSIQAAIDYVQNRNLDSIMYPVVDLKTNFGGTIYVPSGEYILSRKIQVLPKNGVPSADARYAGINIVGDGMTSTIFNCWDMLNDNTGAIHIQGSFAKIQDVGVIGAPHHGVYTSHPVNYCWNIELLRVAATHCAVDGISFGQSWFMSVKGCISTLCGGWGFSFTGGGTSSVIEHNYSQVCTSGGFLLGDRTDLSLSAAFWYSSLISNACDGGVTGYRLAAFYGTLSGNGTEVVTGHSLYLSACNATVNGHVSIRNGLEDVLITGNNADNTISALQVWDAQQPILPAVKMLSTGGKLTLLSTRKGNRDYLYNTGGYECTVSTVGAQSIIINSKLISNSSATEICYMSDNNGQTGSYGGIINVRGMFGGKTPSGPQNSTMYQLIINKSSSTLYAIKEVSYCGLKSGTANADPSGWPSFTFSFSGDKLYAVLTNSSLSPAAYTFEICCGDTLSASKIA